MIGRLQNEGDLKRWIERELVNAPPGTLPARAVQGDFIPSKAHSFAFQNSWSAGNDSTGFTRDRMGFVHLRGFVTGGTPGSVIATLPEGLRPPDDETFIVFAYASGGAFALGVGADGEITPVADAGNTVISLSGVTFRTS